MTFQEIKNLVVAKLGEGTVKEIAPEGLQPVLEIPKERLLSIFEELYNNEKTFFDFLSNITGIDNGAEKGTMEVVYNLYSIPYNHFLTAKVVLDRTAPEIPSVSDIWKTANWHERETFDMFGIRFQRHPDLRRILLPNDWEGYPLKRDYKVQEFYHGIKVD